MRRPAIVAVICSLSVVLVVPAVVAAANYTVGPGDTLWDIADRFGTTVEELGSLNAIDDPNLLHIGQVLRVPDVAAEGVPSSSAPEVYQVAAGDTLAAIAGRYGLSASALAQANGLSDPNWIVSGQVLTVPMPGDVLGVPAALFGGRSSDEAVRGLVPVFDRWADANGLPRDLLKALSYLESGWDNSAVSSVGALGLGQLMPDTVAFVNQVLLGGTRLDPAVPEENVRMSARYLRYLFEAAGNEDDALASYYQGLGAVRSIGWYDDTHRYVANIQALRGHFR